ncbi:NO signaling/Golgi transport ligand-binding domain [Phytophthora cactorum]|nr:NO signaling/Golgi transport ligand-binding domain [Phytophthora cactorum]
MLERYPWQVEGTDATTPTPEEEAAHREAVIIKLEAMGYDVGCRFAERAARDRPRMLEPLDVIKFVCKDFWIAIFKKQIDKLQTNHRGVFVVQDFISAGWRGSLRPQSRRRGRWRCCSGLPLWTGTRRTRQSRTHCHRQRRRPRRPSASWCLFNIKIKQG